MKKSKIKKNFNAFFQKEFLKKKKGIFSLKNERFVMKNFSSVFREKNEVFYGQKPKRLLPLLSASRKENIPSEPFFLNFSFDKGRLKNLVAWFLERYGQYKTIQFLEKLKEFGFGYATQGGLSLGIDDLKIPNQKISLISKAETKVSKDLMDFRNAKITGIERMQRLIYTWNQTNDTLKQEVVKYFETMDLFNPIYMMAFSGARGNMSQVRQLVGMRGLMSDPQGQIIDFPIQSNFREGLTLTEYLISTYGARKGIVDTALRTATAGYLTRRLVDVAQHVIVSQFDCGTMRGIFLFDMKEANKTIYSFQNRLIGRVLAQDIFSFKENNENLKQKIASRNQEIDSKLSFAIAKVSKKALVRSPLTCETPRLICQLCYGWSLSQGKLVSVGEAIGVIAAQSIGEPGTQLTMRTFHTGGVFAGGLTDQILAPFHGKIQYFHNIPGSCIRTSLSEIAFFTKMPGSFFVLRESGNQQNSDSTFPPETDESRLLKSQRDWKQKKKDSNFSELYKIPAYAVLFVRNHEFVQKRQVLAQFSTFAKKQLQYGSAEQTLYSTLSGEFYLSCLSRPVLRSFNNLSKNKKNDLKKTILLVEKRSSDSLDLSPVELQNDILWKVQNWTNIWILSGKIFYNSFDANFFLQEGDALRKTTVLSRILWKKNKGWNFSLPASNIERKNAFLPLFSQKSGEERSKRTTNMLYSKAAESQRNYSFYNSVFAPFSFFFRPLFLHEERKKGGRLFFLSKKGGNQKVNKSPTKTWPEAQKTKNIFERSRLFDFCYFQKRKTAKILPEKTPLRSFRNELFESECEQKAFFEKKEKEKVFSFLNLWIKQSSLVVLNETLQGEKTKSFAQKSLVLKPFFFCFQNQQVLHQFQFLPFRPFSSNSLNFSEKQISKNKKFLKPKKDVIYSGNFQKFFVFSSRKQKKRFFVEKSNRSETKNLLEKKNKVFTNFSSKKKKPLKQIFLKFYSFGRGSSFFRAYNFAKKFNSSQKFLNRDSFKKTILSFQNSCFFTKFLSFKNRSTDLLSLSNRTFQPSFGLSLKIKNERKMKLSFFSHFEKKAYFVPKKIIFSKKFRKLFPFGIEKKKAFVFLGQQPGRGFFFNSFLLKNLKNRNNFYQPQASNQNLQKQIVWKKVLFSFQYDKVRYKKCGYLFSFHDWSKNRFSQNSLRTFTTLKQPNFDGDERVNIGKQKRGVSLLGAEANGNFFGKDFPTFLSYCFPKDYRTATNGIFTVLSFENFSKQQKFNKCLSFSFKEKFSPFLFVDLQKYSFFVYSKKRLSTERKNQKRKKELKKNNSHSVQKKVTFLTCTPIPFVSENTRFSFFDSMDVEKRKNVFQGNSRTNPPSFFIRKKGCSLEQKKKNENSFSYLFEKTKKKKTKNFQISLSLVIEALKKKTTKSFFNSELYTEEIFWLPQENYALSVLDFFPLSKKTKKHNLHKNKNDYVVDIVLKKTPLFYSSNRQGKKKPFFPLFEGVCHFSFFPNGIKYQRFSSFKNRKNIPLKKFDQIQQKLSFYKPIKQKNSEKQRFYSSIFNISQKPLLLRLQQQRGAFGFQNKQKNKTFSFRKSSLRFFKSEFFLNNFSFLFSSFFPSKKRVFSFLFSEGQKKRTKQKVTKGLKPKLSSSTKTRKKTKKWLFFKEKKRKFLKHFSKSYFSKKVHQSLKKNFYSSFQKKIVNQNLKLRKKLFSDDFSKKYFFAGSNLQTKVGKSFQHQCFSCVPFQKFISLDKSLSSSSLKKFNSLQPFVTNEDTFPQQQKDSSFESKAAFCCGPKDTCFFERKKEENKKENQSKDFYLESQKIQIQIQYGWICFFPNSFVLSNWHQTIANIGHFFGKDLCFEQNKIFVETKVFNPSSFSPKVFSSKLSFFVRSKPNSFFKKNSVLQKKVGKNISVLYFQTIKTKKTGFSIKSLKKNSKCRFLNNDSMHAFENFAPAVFSGAEEREENNFWDKSTEETQNYNFSKKIQKKIFSHGKQKISFGFSFRPSNKKRLRFFCPSFFCALGKKNQAKNKACSFFLSKAQKKTPKRKKIFALFFRPMQYKLLENPNNYKNLFMNATIKNCSTKESSISFISSLKIYKKYHSSVLNLQKPERIFLQNRKNMDSTLHSNFQKLHISKQLQHLFATHKIANKFKKNQRFLDLGLSKKDTLKKISPFQYSSKKNLFFKFRNLLIRDIQKNSQNSGNKNKKLSPFVFPFQESREKAVLRFSPVQKNFYNKNFHGNYFFSFYPIQFLPLALSNSFLKSFSADFKNSQTFPTFVFHPLNRKIDFCFCQKKSAFVNQRFSSFDFFKKYVETASFWLNKDGINFVFGFYGKELPYKKNSKNFWKVAASLLEPKNTMNQQNFSLFIRNGNIKTKTQLFKNFVFRKNHSFYANTKFFSPFEGELLSMHTNETSWWKKASEISTLQKLNSLFSIVTKKDLFSIAFKNKKNLKQKRKISKLFIPLLSNGNKNLFLPIEFRYSLKTKQKHLTSLYEVVFKTQKTFKSFDFSSKNSKSTNEVVSFQNGTDDKSFFSNRRKQNLQISSFVTKYENKLYTFKKLKIGYPDVSKSPILGSFFVYGDCLFDVALRKPGQVVHINASKATFRHSQPFLVSPRGILHLANTPYIQKNVPILTLPYQTVQSGDIVQGIPKVEQLFEARTTVQGRLFLSSLPILLKGIFERYKSALPLEQAVRQSFLKIQQLIVDGVQRVYRSQGVSIVDKHLEVIVRQMTTKVQIIHGAQTGFFPGELVDLNLVERINKFLLVKVRYEPVVLGITRASLEVDSFLSASSFQQTTKILALASISRKKDFLKGLKENILVGNLIPSGTGYMVLRKNL